jgi:pimeloyl-ACP methyl ester carboxylesterase
MKTITSKDGTTIAFDQTGAGQPVIPVTGGFGYSKFPGSLELAALLSPDFTVINYDRRGRGDSGDTQPYAVAREIEDIEALIDTVGGSAFLCGMSSGAILALEAANQFPDKVKKLALYEPPFVINDSRPPVSRDFVKQLKEAIAAGRPGDAIDIIMTQALLIPAEYLKPMRDDPMWPEMIKVAHTLVYDGMIQADFMAGKPLPRNRWTHVNLPTLVMNGENSDQFFQDGAQALVDLLSNAQHRILQGQSHNVSMKVVAPVLKEFFLLKGEPA